MATFRARARALDMLGRQQIAGRPNAISELFKNAHDAYADRVEVDYYRTDGLFVLRDDGLGMSRQDFEERWLTLGTESKVDAAAGIRPPPIDPSKPVRPVLGEKGIGRLAIAAIGPQCLILSRRSVTLTGDSEVVACFIHWGLFECPGVDLDQIEIPIESFRPGTLPSRADVSRLVSAVQSNLQSLSSVIAPDNVARIGRDLAAFDVDPVQIDLDLKSPSLILDGQGTHFFIKPADENLKSEIDDVGDDYDVTSPLIRTLIGFTNTMTPDHSDPRIKVAFRDHKTDEVYDEPVRDAEYFTPYEFLNADHHLRGSFDEYGQFRGMVSIYGDVTNDHVVPWREARGHRTECGPFNINLAYVQGVARESTLPADQWLRMTRKLNKIGGLYVYKDGIRVLPYGNSDVDYLEIERRRSKSASYYFFSYRRMFGVIELTRATNPNLVEKAGREGFRENRAYRQFRDILKNFLIQIAADFFREGGARADAYVQKRSEFELVDIARKRREKQVTTRRNSFRQSLEKTLQRIEEGGPETEMADLLETFGRDVDSAAAEPDIDRAVRQLLELETTGRRRMQALRDSYRVVKPRGVGLSKTLLRDWVAYSDGMDRIDGQVFNSGALRLSEIVGEAARNGNLPVDRRSRVERGVSERAEEALRIVASEGRTTHEVADEVSQQVLALTRQSFEEIDVLVRRVMADLSSVDLAKMDDATTVAQRLKLEDEIDRSLSQKRELLENVREQLGSINLTPDEEGRIVGTSEVEEALDQDLIALRERADADVELTQLGMAIGVITHEFEGTIKSVRSNLQRLKAWADVNDGLAEIYGNIRASFDHLDGYLSLFTPLHRRLYRKPVEIQGKAMFDFIDDLFRERLRRHNITLEATPGFLRLKLFGFPSTFYPVMVNLVDNASFWLTQAKGEQLIKLDARDGTISVSDSGPGVPNRDTEAIFDLGFTRKPGGRGMGLHISREVLKEAHYRLILDRSSSVGATFLIEPDSTELIVEIEE